LGRMRVHRLFSLGTVGIAQVLNVIVTLDSRGCPYAGGLDNTGKSQGRRCQLSGNRRFMANNYRRSQADSVRLLLFLRGFVKNPALPALRVETGNPGKRTKWPRNGQSKRDCQDRDENDDYV